MQLNLFDEVQTKKLSRDKVANIIAENQQNGIRAQEFLKKIEEKTLTNDEVIDLMYVFLKDFSATEIHFLSLYNGVYKKCIEMLCEKYPEYFIKEYIKTQEGMTILKLFNGIGQKLANGKEGTRGLINFMRALVVAKDILLDQGMDSHKIEYIQNFLDTYQERR